MQDTTQNKTNNQIETYCIICNKTHVHYEFLQSGLLKSFKAIICPLSGFRSVYPSPASLSGGSAYKGSKGLSTKDTVTTKNILRKAWIKLRLRPTMMMLMNNLSGGKVLDIGAGDGTLIRSIKARDTSKRYTFSALEVSDADFAHLKKTGIDVKQSTLEDAGFPENSFDAVLSTHVFEHIPALVELIAEIRKVLKPGGLLVASVPSDTALSMRLGLKRDWMDLGIQGHLYSFNKSNFPKLISNCGFKIITAKETLFVPQISVAGNKR